MARQASLQLFFLLAVVYCASAQKVKYKDIYALLSAKQYESAEPFLNRYLKDNTDNPNAYLFKGLIFQEKATKDDVLKQTSRMQANIDSAIVFYDIAYKAINEKEVKKNGEYYAAYNRRDLRTGEFGVALSDIQFDLEKRMEGLRERKDRIRMVKHYFLLADTLYKKSQTLYKGLQATYHSERVLYLRADDSLIESLVVLANRFDSCVQAFDQYRSASMLMGKTGYNQVLEGKEITQFTQEGTSPADFYASKVALWDYATFARGVRTRIEHDIVPMRQHLITYDAEINKLHEKLTKENVSVRSDLTSLIDRLLMEQLRKYDEAPLPMDLFAVKIAELEYRSLEIENNQRTDTSSLHVKMDMARKALSYASKLDSVSRGVMARNLDSLALDYPHFVTASYGNIGNMKGMVKAASEYASAAHAREQEKLAKLSESMRWIVSGPDSIPLFMGKVNSKFRPLIIAEERFTAGIQYADSISPLGYLYSINVTRTPEVKVTFPVEKNSFRESQVDATKALSFIDVAGNLYYVLIYSVRPGTDNQFDVTLAKIYKSDGLAWSTNYKLAFIPKELQFATLTGEVSILGEEGEKTTLDKKGAIVN